MGKPQRMFQLTLTIGADSLEELRDRFDGLIETVRGIRTTYFSMEAGPNSSSITRLVFDPNMTHDKYIEELEKHLQHLENEE